MYLKDYIYINYKQKFGEDIPITLKHLLDSYYVKEIPIDDFMKEFSLDSSDFNQVLTFILDENNSYELAKFCYRYYENNQYEFNNDRIRSARDDYKYDDSDKYTKKFR